MITLKDIGSFDTLPQIVYDLIDGNTLALDEYLTQGWEIEKAIELDEYTRLSPLDCALTMEAFESIKWLVAHGANLNVKENPSFLLAVRYCSEPIIRYLVEQGADVNGVNHVKTDAFEQAIYGKRYENLSLIHQLGHRVEQYGGQAFRSAITLKNYTVLDFFIQNGVDINYNRPDSVYPFKPTPLCVAARYVDLKMCQYLVAHGADVTLTEKDGMRPYSIALELGNVEMAEYFKALEPEDYHSLQNKLDELKPFKLPKEMLAFLQGDKLDFQLEDCDIECIEFFSIMDTIPMKIGRQKLLRLSKSMSDYSDLLILWHPKTKQIAYYDLEHEELKDIADFKTFLENIGTYLQQIIDGDL